MLRTMISSPDGVVDKIWVFPRDELSHAFDCLRSAHLRKEYQVLERLKNGGTHMPCGVRIARANVVGDGRQVLGRSGRKTKLHRSKRRNADSTSSSVAN